MKIYFELILTILTNTLILFTIFADIKATKDRYLIHLLHFITSIATYNIIINKNNIYIPINCSNRHHSHCDLIVFGNLLYFYSVILILHKVITYLLKLYGPNLIFFEEKCFCDEIYNYYLYLSVNISWYYDEIKPWINNKIENNTYTLNYF